VDVTAIAVAWQQFDGVAPEPLLSSVNKAWWLIDDVSTSAGAWTRASRSRLEQVEAQGVDMKADAGFSQTWIAEDADAFMSAEDGEELGSQ